MTVQASSTPTVEYYFSFLSLWSYVGSRAFRALTERTGAEIVYKPVDLMAVFAAGGSKPVKQRPLQRQAYRLVEMQRWRRIRGIPLVLHPKFYPADPSLAHRVLLAALDEDRAVADFVHAGLRVPHKTPDHPSSSLPGTAVQREFCERHLAPSGRTNSTSPIPARSSASPSTPGSTASGCLPGPASPFTARRRRR